jgi:hypothetical protein
MILIAGDVGDVLTIIASVPEGYSNSEKSRIFSLNFPLLKPALQNGKALYTAIELFIF